eukprot:scaffold180_cov311-Pinguiococcus_pyrenoidosus.AAC.15
MTTSARLSEPTLLVGTPSERAPLRIPAEVVGRPALPSPIELSNRALSRITRASALNPSSSPAEPSRNTLRSGRSHAMHVGSWSRSTLEWPTRMTCPADRPAC